MCLSYQREEGEKKKKKSSCILAGSGEEIVNITLICHWSRNVRKDCENALMVAIILITYHSQKQRNQSCTDRTLTNFYENQKGINIHCVVEIAVKDFLVFHGFPLYFFLLLPPNSTVENAVNERSKSNIRSQMSLDM